MQEEPVNIDIILRQNVDEESGKASRSIEQLADSSEDAWKRSEEALKLQRDVIARLRRELEPLKAQFDKVNIGTHDPKILAERQRLSKTIKSMTAELRGEEAALNEMTAASEKLTQKSKTLETQMRQVREAMAALSMAGKKDTAEYAAQREKLESLSTAYREVYQTQLQLSKGGANLQGIVSGLSALTGILSAGAGTMGLFNANSEEFNAIQTKMQSLMAITIGLQQVQNTLHTTSAFRINTVTKAKQLWAAANLKVATTLGISTVAAKALMTTLTLGLSAAIGAVIAVTDNLIKRQRAAREEMNKLNETIASNSASQIAIYEKLRNSYNRLGDDVKAKEKFILDNQDAFKQLGVSIADVNDADSAFIRNTEAFKNAIRQRAIATAAMELAAEQYKKMLIERQKVQEKIDEGVEKSRAMMEARGNIEGGGSASDNTRVLRPELQFQPVIKTVTEDQAEKEMSMYLSDAEKKYAKAGDKWIAQSNAASEAEQKILEALGLAPSGEKTKTPYGTQTDQGSDAAKAGERLAKLSADIQRDIDAAVVASMQDGRDKKLAELDNEYKLRTNLIAERMREIEELEKSAGVDGSLQKSKLAELETAEKAKYDAAVKAITDGSAAAIAGIWDEINSRFESESQYRLTEIDRFYQEQIAKARENGASQMDIDNLSLAHKRDIELEKQQIALETIDFETQIEMKRAQIADKNVMLQSAREEKMIQVQIAGAHKRLKKLREIQASGVDTGKEIAQVTAEIEAMNAELNNIPGKKLQELAGYAQQVLDGIGNFAAVFDEDLVGLADMASGAIGGIASLGTGIASGNPQEIIKGAMQLLDVVGKVIAANKQANEEIRKFNLSLAQQAIDYSLAVIRAIKDIKSETDSIFSSNYTNTLTQGMAGYNAAIDKQVELMRSLGSETVKTGVKKKKFLGITYGTRDVYSSLLKTYPDLINKDGELNRELAESLKKSGNLSDKTTQLIDNIIQASDAANEAMQLVESELQNLVGSIGQELKKVLDDGFASGTDAAKGMVDNVVMMLKELSTQKLFNAVFGGLFNKLEGRMKDSFAQGGDGDLSDDISWFMGEYVSGVDEYNKGLQQIRDEIKKQYGVDPFATESDAPGRQAVEKGIAQASQDSIDELNGRATFLVMKVQDIAETNSKHTDISREQLLVQRAMEGWLETIAENSFFLTHLAEIDENIQRMARDGIYMKK